MHVPNTVTGSALYLAGLVALAPASYAATPLPGETDRRIVLGFDILPDESDLEVSSSLGSSTLEDAEWDDSYRIAIDFGTQRLLSEAGGPLLTTGLGLGYSRYEVDEGDEEFAGEAILLTPRIGIGVHAMEWLFLEANAFGGIGLSQFTYTDESIDFEEDSDGDFAWEYGLYGAATFALAETFLVGARVGWITQHIEGDFDGGALGDVTLESDSSGMFYGAFLGLRF